jgi:hypothetical protein
MKKAFLIFSLLLLSYLGYTSLSKKRETENSNSLVLIEATEKRVKEQVQIIRDFLQKKPTYNSNIVFLVDMKIMSGKNRFFVYDLKQKKVIDEGLVAHGSGSETRVVGELKFSNTNNSYATSLGKYVIGEKYSGKFGEAYKLTGLDKTNSNARSRSIVLHKYNSVPYEEQLDPIVNSLGCPMVNKTYFERIEKLVDDSEKPILLTIYY